MTIKNVDMDFEFINYIDESPRPRESLYQQACTNDNITVKSWHKTWVDNVRSNNLKYGPFRAKSFKDLWGKYKFSPVIIMGSGPSLKNNIHFLKNTNGIPVISCLHNYHYCIDNDVNVNYFVSLDAGEITLSEISEGGTKTPIEYLESTKDKTLLTYVGSSPKLLDAWKGEIRFFNCPVPNEQILKEITEIEEFNTYVSSGGNVLGASAYIAKALFGANPICFVGADFSFSYTKKFHAWKSQYDEKLGNCMRATDVFGNKVITWQSYFNFKCWFDWLVQTVPGSYFNCTEGGIMGSYPEGNIRALTQMELNQFIKMYNMCEDMKVQCLQPEIRNNKILF